MSKEIRIVRRLLTSLVPSQSSKLVAVVPFWAGLGCDLGESQVGEDACVADLALTGRVGCLDAGKCCLSGMEDLEASIGPVIRFGEPVVLLKDKVEVFFLQNFDRLAAAADFENRADADDAGQIGPAPVNHHPLRYAVGSQFAPEEAPSRPRSRCSESMEIKGFSMLVHHPIEVGPVEFLRDVGLVHPPRSRRPTPARLWRSRDKQRQLHNSMVQRRVINRHPARRGSFPGRERIARNRVGRIPHAGLPAAGTSRSRDTADAKSPFLTLHKAHVMVRFGEME